MTNQSNSEYTSQGVVAGSIPLFAGHPSRDLIPASEIQRTLDDMWRDETSMRMFEYGNEQGDPDLIAFLVERFNQHEQLNITSDNMMIIGGSTAGVTLMTTLLAQAGDTILVDSPSYRDALHIFHDNGLDMHGVPIDGGGVIIEEMVKTLEMLRKAERLPKFYYVVPTFQNPSGITLSRERRLEIIELSQLYGFTIVEDDVYSDIRFVDDVPPSFYELVNGENVIRLGTFSKTLSPGMRLGWMISDLERIEQFVTSGTMAMGGGANPFTARLVAQFCWNGAWDNHVQWLRGRYQTRRDTALKALEKHMPEGVTWTQPEGGYFIWVTLPDSVTVDELEKLANAQNVYFASGRGFYVNPDNGAHGLRLSYSLVTFDDMKRGIAVLGNAIRQLIV